MIPMKGCTCGDFIRCQRCTNCVAGLKQTDDGFVFRCGSCGATGWVHGSAADVITAIRIEMREEAKEARTSKAPHRAP